MTLRPLRVQLLLFLLAVLVLLGLPVVGVAPNRILTPTGRTYAEVWLTGQWWLLLLPMLLMGLIALGWWRWQAARCAWLVASLTLALLAWLAGDYASQGSQVASASRYSLGGGFWALLLLWWMMAMDAVKRFAGRASGRSASAVLFWLPLALVLASGHTDQLSLWLEYKSNSAIFQSALGEHLRIVAMTLGLTVILGLYLGIRSAFHRGFGQICLNVLGILQTVPSIALFGLLIAPLSALSQAQPWIAALGIKGIGAAPAVIALVAYSLLPMVRSTVAGLHQVPPQVLEAARGMGMSARQTLWQVHLRLALPVILSGLRVTTVQAIGLTVVAALIGAGGFGAIMFRGLSASAIDLVLLGVIPVVALAAASDAAFLWLERWSLGRSPDSAQTTANQLASA